MGIPSDKAKEAFDMSWEIADLKTQLKAAREQIVALNNQVSIERERGDRNWKGWLRAENEILPARVAEARSELEAKLAAAREENARLKDAERIVWCLRNAEDNPRENVFIERRERYGKWILFSDYTPADGWLPTSLGMDRWLVLTDEARLIIDAAMAKEPKHGSE